MIAINSESPFLCSARTALAILAAALLSPSWEAVAQLPDSETSSRWQAQGWQLPEGFSPEQIALFEGLDKACGTWSFAGETNANEGTTTPLQGNLEIVGKPKAGMFSGWNMSWRWPAEDPQHAIIDSIMAIPGKSQFDLMLARFGPMKNSEADLSKQKPKTPPTLFKGTWNAQNRTITWTKEGLSFEPSAQAAKENSPQQGQSFEMALAENGALTIQNSENTPRGHMSTGRAIVRTGEAPEQPAILSGRRSFQSAAEITDPRITRYLPPGATEISLFSERAGHQASYKISAKAFDEFLVAVWDRYRADQSAAPESWVAYSEEDIAKERAGSPVGRYEPKVHAAEIAGDKPMAWEPLENAVSYSGPRKMSAAGATYYYDREAGLAYHNAGYW